MIKVEKSTHNYREISTAFNFNYILHFLMAFCSSKGGFLNASLKNHTALTSHTNGKHTNPAENKIEIEIIYYKVLHGTVN